MVRISEVAAAILKRRQPPSTHEPPMHQFERFRGAGGMQKQGERGREAGANGWEKKLRG